MNEMKPKTFMVKGADGKPIEARQLATFAYYLQGEQFRFVVTELPLQLPGVTHRASGSRVCLLTPLEIQAARGDYADAGKRALKKVIDRAGEARVRSALAAAEGKPQQAAS